MRLRPIALASLVLAGCTSESPGEGDGDIACDPSDPASSTIACVQSFTPGEGAGYGQDEYPQVIYGEPQGSGVHEGSTDVLSLGKGGSIVVGFGASAIVDGPGPDFIVFENAFYKGDNPMYPFAELGEISVSDDGETWSTFPCKTDAFPFDGCAGWHAVFAGSDPAIDTFDPAEAGGEAFDLADLGIDRARFVRVDDRTLAGAGGNAGFDLDAMAIVNADR